jgi:uncharacterized membrane protein YgcG
MPTKTAMLFLAAILVLPHTASAQRNMPSTEEKCINDHAGTMNKGDLSAIKSMCKRAEKEKIQMMVVTIASLDDIRPRPLSVDRFADNLFNDWDTGYEEGADAVMLFVSIKENEFRILMGDRYEDPLRKKASKIIRSTLVGNFRRRKRSQGIRQAYSRLFHEVVKPHIRALKKANKPKYKPIDFDTDE